MNGMKWFLQAWAKGLKARVRMSLVLAVAVIALGSGAFALGEHGFPAAESSRPALTRSGMAGAINLPSDEEPVPGSGEGDAAGVERCWLLNHRPA
jgi:hypothetical protein